MTIESLNDIKIHMKDDSLYFINLLSQHNDAIFNVI